MTEKKHIYEAEVMALPPLRMVLGEVPSPDPEGRRKSNQQPLKSNREMVVPVKRLIAHLKDEK
jgi:hypothetical protein